MLKVAMSTNYYPATNCTKQIETINSHKNGNHAINMATIREKFFMAIVE